MDKGGWRQWENTPDRQDNLKIIRHYALSAAVKRRRKGAARGILLTIKRNIKNPLAISNSKQIATSFLLLPARTPLTPLKRENLHRTTDGVGAAMTSVLENRLPRIYSSAAPQLIRSRYQ